MEQLNVIWLELFLIKYDNICKFVTFDDSDKNIN